MWRGYKACVSSQQPKLNSIELARRYNLAIKSIKQREKDDDHFKKPSPSSDAEDVTQIPETQFDMEGTYNT